ncbi:hypothetical protein ACFL20_08830 [Spirochaetota bacterium]
MRKILSIFILFGLILFANCDDGDIALTAIKNAGGGDNNGMISDTDIIVYVEYTGSGEVNITNQVYVHMFDGAQPFETYPLGSEGFTWQSTEKNSNYFYFSKDSLTPYVNINVFYDYDGNGALNPCFSPSMCDRYAYYYYDNMNNIADSMATTIDVNQSMEQIYIQFNNSYEWYEIIAK